MSSMLVALRKESVDRNRYQIIRIIAAAMSLSARRAWIEICKSGGAGACYRRRSPQGERG